MVQQQHNMQHPRNKRRYTQAIKEDIQGKSIIRKEKYEQINLKTIPDAGTVKLLFL